MSRGISRTLSTTVPVLLASRVFGLLRDVVLVAAFGLSQTTDLFLQASFPIVVILMVTNGPLTTAFAANLQQAVRELRGDHIRHYARVVAYASIGCFLLYVGAGSLLLLSPMPRNPGTAEALLALAPAAAGTVFVGYAYAVCMAVGKSTQAALVMLATNVPFVLWVALVWVTGSHLESWTLPLGYSLNVLVGVAVAIVTLRPFGVQPQLWLLPSQGSMPGFRRSFAFASIESSAFILTQFLVLALASFHGTGWASAATVAQRVAFSINGLVINPMSSLLMLSVLRAGHNGARVFARAFALSFLGLAGTALLMVGVVEWSSVDLVTRWDGERAESFQILRELFPAFCLWMVPIGLNTILARVMFGVRLAGLYTSVTMGGYIAANLARLTFSIFSGFPISIAAGAIIEFAIVVGIAAYSLTHAAMRSEPR